MERTPGSSSPPRRTRSCPRSSARSAWACLATSSVRRFPTASGLRLASRVADSDAFLVGGTGSDADTLELYDLACALVERGVHALTLRSRFWLFDPGAPEQGLRSSWRKPRTKLFSSFLCWTARSVSFWLDLHTAGLPFALRGRRPAGARQRATALRRGDPRACPGRRRGGEHGRVPPSTWRRSPTTSGPTRLLFKRRESGGTVGCWRWSARVAGQHVMLYDDMVWNCSAPPPAAEAYRDGGSGPDYRAGDRHGAVPGDALGRLGAERAVRPADSKLPTRTRGRAILWIPGGAFGGPAPRLGPAGPSAPGYARPPGCPPHGA